MLEHNILEFQIANSSKVTSLEIRNLEDAGHTSRKIPFVVGSERLFSSVFDPTLTQEMLNQTSV